MEALHLDFFQSVFALPAWRLLDPCNISAQGLAQCDDDDCNDDEEDEDEDQDNDDEDDCDESNVDSPGKVQPSLMWGHFCCATHHP